MNSGKFSIGPHEHEESLRGSVFGRNTLKENVSIGISKETAIIAKENFGA